MPEGGTGYIYDGVQSINNTTLDGNRTLEFTGGTTTIPKELTITSSGFSIKGGTLKSYKILSDGGTFDVSGGVWNMGTERFALYGNSFMTISGDSVINFGGCYFLNGRESKATTIQSGDSILNLNSVWLDGLTGGWFNIGEQEAANGSSYTLQSGTINVNSGGFRVTHGTFTQSGGVLNVSNGSGIELRKTNSVFNLTSGTLNLNGNGYINATQGTFNVTGGSITVTPTAIDATAGKKIVGIFSDENTAQNVLSHTTMVDGWTAGVVTVNNQPMILAGQGSVPTGLKIWKAGTTGAMSESTNWEGTTDDTTGYVFSGTNTFTDFSGNLIINGGENTINSASDPQNNPLITAGQTLVSNNGTTTLGNSVTSNGYGYILTKGSIVINGGKIQTYDKTNIRAYGTEENIAYIEVNGTLNVTRYLALANGDVNNPSQKPTAKMVINNGAVYCGKSGGGGFIIADVEGSNAELEMHGGLLQIENKLTTDFANKTKTTAKFTMTGGTFKTGGEIHFATGANTTATVDISGGEIISTNRINIGTGSGAKAEVTVSGGEITATRFQVGGKNAKENVNVYITGGKLNITQDICGHTSNSGCLYVSNSGQIVLNSSYTGDVGIREISKFQISGAGDGTGALRFLKSLDCNVPLTLDGNATIGIEPGATFTQKAAIAQTKASVLTIQGGGTLALSAASSFTGGTIIDSSAVNLSGAGTLGTGAITLNDGTLILNGVTSSIASNISGTGDITVSSGTATLTGSVTQEGGATTLASGTTLSLSADSTLNNFGSFNGTLNAGNLTLNNDEKTKFIGSITAQSITKTGNGTLQLCALTEDSKAIDAHSMVVSSGRLDMQEYFKGSLQVEEKGTLSPGNSIGILTVDGTELSQGVDALVLDSGSTLLMEIGSTEAEGNDQLIVNGPVTFNPGSIIQFELDTTSGYFPSNGEIIHVNMPDVDWEDVTFSSTYFTLMGYEGGQMLLGVDSNAIPEPSTWALLILGAAGLLYVRKRNK